MSASSGMANDDTAVEIVKALLAAGADVNAQGYQTENGNVSSYQDRRCPQNPISILTEAISP